MKSYMLNLTSFFLLFYIVDSHTVAFSHEKRRKVSKDLNSSDFQNPLTKDKTILRDSLSLLNIGKKTLNLSTENPELLMGLIENSTMKADHLHRLFQASSNNLTVPGGEEYLVLSGKDGHIQVDNYTKTLDVNKVSNDNNAEDVFKLVLEKKYPQKINGSQIFHRLTIIESDQVKPFDQNMLRLTKFANRGKRHKIKHSIKFPSMLRSRKKRMKDESDLKYLLKNSPNEKRMRDESILSHLLENSPYSEIHNQDHIVDESIRKSVEPMKEDENYQELDYPFVPAYERRHLFGHYPWRLNDLNLNTKKREMKNVKFSVEKPILRFSHENELNIATDVHKSASTESILSTKASDKDGADSVAHQEQSLEKSLLMRVLQLPPKVDETDKGSGSFLPIASLMLAFIMCIVMAFLLYRLWQIKKSKDSRTLELKGANVIVRFGKSLGKQLEFSEMKARKQHFNIPLGKMNYQLVPVEEPGVDLEWQSENGEWLSERDFEQREVYS